MSSASAVEIDAARADVDSYTARFSDAQGVLEERRAAGATAEDIAAAEREVARIGTLLQAARGELEALVRAATAEPEEEDGVVMRGLRVFTFIDPGKAPQRIPFAKTAPNWLVATSGLNLEGSCRNAACDASKSYVILKLGMVTDLDLSEARFDKKCPQCGAGIHYSTISTMAVSNCQWSFRGRQVDHEEESRGGGTVDNAYHRFLTKESVDWHYLKVTTAPIGK